MSSLRPTFSCTTLGRSARPPHPSAHRLALHSGQPRSQHSFHLPFAASAEVVHQANIGWHYCAWSNWSRAGYLFHSRIARVGRCSSRMTSKISYRSHRMATAKSDSAICERDLRRSSVIGRPAQPRRLLACAGGGS